MRKLVIYIYFFSLNIMAGAQGIYNNGANFVLTSGTSVYVNGDGGYITASNGEVDVQNTGELILEGDWTNNNGSDNAITNTATTGWVRFEGNGAGAQTISGTAETTFPYLEFNNSNGITLSVNATTPGNLELTSGIITTGTNYLIHSSTTASDLITYSNTAFVNGNYRRYLATNTSTYAFPVGNGTVSTDYHLAELINESLTGGGFTYLDAKFDALPTGGTLGVTEEGTSYTDICTDGVWYLDADNNPAGGKYDMKCYTTNLGCGLVDNEFSILKRATASSDAADWACTPCGFSSDPADGINAGNGLGRMVSDGYALRRGFTSFSQFGIGKSSVVLPIELLEIYVECISGNKEIHWSTLSETNVSSYIIEKSLNGIDYYNLGIVQVDGNTNSLMEYQLFDDEQSSGTLFYRLRIEDIDGGIQYSEVISSKRCGELNQVEVDLFPNPNNGQFYIQGLSGEASDITVVNSLGQVVQVINTEEINLSIDLSNIAPGIYTVSISTGEDWLQKKIIVN
jgi:hypothetical protein